MRYFTPERWLRLQDVDTPEAFADGQTGWQAALDAYRAELARLAHRLPAGLADFARDVCLHDGVVVGSWLGEGRLVLLVRDEGGVVELAYDLAGPPVVLRDVLPTGWRSDEPQWAYDEVGVDGDAFTHDVLLRDGTELRLRFVRLACSRVAPLLATPEHAMR